MERRGFDEISLVSKWWTPEHLDVTHVPYTYARPKATWIDGFDRLKHSITTDVDDRMARHRTQSHAVVDPGDLGIMPPLDGHVG